MKKYYIQVILQGIMTFTFTKAHAQMVSRLFELKLKEYKECTAKNHSFHNELKWANSIEMHQYVRCVSNHERECEYGGEIEEDEEYEDCTCKREYESLFKITTIPGVLGENRQNLFEIIIKADTPLHELISKVNENAGMVYHTCSCGGIALQGKSQCQVCYIYSYERTDEQGGSCALCYENHGLWAMVKRCKHVFHKHCLDKCAKKCPLCRHEFEHYCSPNGVIINPYM